ncbi:MAG: phage tail sheath family protein [Gammaproteobacteria bacterium]
MAKPMKTPGVYIVEKNAFPNSVVEVATAVPAFIGYTEKALNQDASLHNVPRRVTSMAEFHNYFGAAPPVRFAVSELDTDSPAIRAWDAAAAAADAAQSAISAATDATSPQPPPNARANAASAAAKAARAANDAAASAQLAANTSSEASAALASVNEALNDPENPAAKATAKAAADAAASAIATGAAAEATTAAAASDPATPDLAESAYTATAAASTAAQVAQASAEAARDAAPGDPTALQSAATAAATVAKGAAAAADVAAKAAKVAADVASATDADAVEGAKTEADAARTEADQNRQPGRPDDPAVRGNGKAYYLDQTGDEHILYWCMRSFFQNGGGPCYVVSVGSYSDAPASADLMGGIKTLVKEPEPTMVVIPEAVLLAEDDCISVQQQSMNHCRSMQSRVSILDVYRGFEDRASDPDCITRFRSKLGNVDLDYAAAYYPWIETTMVQDNDIGVTTIDPDSRDALKRLIKNDLALGDVAATSKEEQQFELITELDEDHWKDPARKSADDLAKESLLHKSLVANSGAYKRLFESIKGRMNRLPPSAAMAGVYTMVDNTRGVWKAPANVSLNGVIRPSVNISHDEQEDLNVNAQGKSVNAIRTFVGEGTLVWGARTLDGNSLDWRYISVRRTLIMLEQSLKLASKAYVFEANDANTWITMKSMARNFLTGIWRRGGLAGATPDEAFSVYVGLGETMTAEDILEGILRITILVAPVRPAEFIEITFQQQMQKS